MLHSKGVGPEETFDTMANVSPNASVVAASVVADDRDKELNIDSAEFIQKVNSRKTVVKNMGPSKS